MPINLPSDRKKYKSARSRDLDETGVENVSEVLRPYNQQLVKQETVIGMGSGSVSGTTTIGSSGGFIRNSGKSVSLRRNPRAEGGGVLKRTMSYDASRGRIRPRSMESDLSPIKTSPPVIDYNQSENNRTGEN